MKRGSGGRKGDATRFSRLEIALGGDGNVWYTESNNKIGRMTLSGVATDYSIPTASSSPYGIFQGPDHNVYFVGTLGDGSQNSLLPLSLRHKSAAPAAPRARPAAAVEVVHQAADTGPIFVAS
jgi:streptogramin lyase